ncbi:hypothetical protein PUN28_008318 [Cardiocondyla obscurior]|uniref:THAP-type domain-containing protein n=1 Tax=Cardiocondyla obscurior TaxID=286306 RepID=A0AAW2G0C5_9HYME
MVRHCCVPGCTSNINALLHRFPKDVQRASTWFIAIGCQNLCYVLKLHISFFRHMVDKVDNEKYTECIGIKGEGKVAQLRICTEHFSEDMFLKDRARRCLKENAIPTLHLDLQNDTNNIISTTAANIETCASKNVQEDSMLMPTIPEEINVVETNNSKIKVLKAEISKCKKLLHKKKLIIKKQRCKLRKKSTWNDILKDVSGTQRTFFELVSNNMKSAPQVSFLIVYF